MNLTLYTTTDDDNVINKDKSVISNYEVVLKDPNNITTPDIRLKETKINLDGLANYAYLEEFNRYYFVRTVHNMSNEIWVLALECDVLESFKDDILNSNAEITRAIREHDYQQANIRSEVVESIQTYDSTVTLPEDEYTLILSTIGGD